MSAGVRETTAARRRTEARRDGAGFTLIEVIITLAVFGVGFLALAAIVPLGFKKNNSATIQSRASELAAATAERLMHIPYMEPDLDAGNHEDADNPHFGRYHVKWSVEENAPITKCKRITITVHVPAVTSPQVARIVVVTSEAGS
jgi:prepilin-type N-terminal cleavage/methylation domain-containing protein